MSFNFSFYLILCATIPETFSRNKAPSVWSHHKYEIPIYSVCSFVRILFPVNCIVYSLELPISCKWFILFVWRLALDSSNILSVHYKYLWLYIQLVCSHLKWGISYSSDDSSASHLLFFNSYPYQGGLFSFESPYLVICEGVIGSSLIHISPFVDYKNYFKRTILHLFLYFSVLYWKWKKTREREKRQCKWLKIENTDLLRSWIGWLPVCPNASFRSHAVVTTKLSITGFI